MLDRGWVASFSGPSQQTLDMTNSSTSENRALTSNPSTSLIRSKKKKKKAKMTLIDVMWMS
jgi:hypothetical protein